MQAGTLALSGKYKRFSSAEIKNSYDMDESGSFNRNNDFNRMSSKEIKFFNSAYNEDSTGGKKPKDKKKDYSKERKQKRGE